MLATRFELTCGLLYPFAAGAAVHYVPGRRGPDLLRVLAEQRITHMLAAPRLLASMGQTVEAQLRARLPAAGASCRSETAPRQRQGARRSPTRTPARR